MELQWAAYLENYSAAMTVDKSDAQKADWMVDWLDNATAGLWVVELVVEMVVTKVHWMAAQWVWKTVELMVELTVVLLVGMRAG